MIYSNIVSEDKVREVQKDTLNIIASSLEKSFGPKGSSTAIVKNLDKNEANISVEWTKDGHTIVNNILFVHPIERSVQDLLSSLTRYIVKEVGDGTTSAIILCKTVFETLCESDIIGNNSPADVLSKFSDVISKVKSRIMSKARPCTIDDIYNIALISTNNNKDAAKSILHVYEEFGIDVDIDVGINNGIDNIVKLYEGMILDTPFAHACMINDKNKNTASVPNPRIYCFEDPIDTPEMLGFLDIIIKENIMKAYTPGSIYEPVPTVILCHAITPDSSSFFEPLVKLMSQVPNVPFLLVSDIHQDYLYEDIAQMCGAKFIKKYIDPTIQENAISQGLAPTNETIVDFCGSADLVVADCNKTKIVNPKKMLNEDGSYSDDYNMYVNYLQGIVDKMRAENGTIKEIQEAERRLNSFKGKSVDYLVGGITNSDKLNLKASIEDAVFNCKSAAKYGVGYGANYMAFKVLTEMMSEIESKGHTDESVFVEILYSAYVKLISILYNKHNEVELEELKQQLEYNDGPLNIRTNEYDGKVLSSIRSDIVILDTIDHILMRMFTCNQYLVQTPVHNVYIDHSK